MAATVFVAAVISSLLRLWSRWRDGRIVKINSEQFATVESIRVSAGVLLQTVARKEDVPF
jgi:hypothetical protein